MHRLHRHDECSTRIRQSSWDVDGVGSGSRLGLGLGELDLGRRVVGREDTVVIAVCGVEVDAMF